MGYFFGPFPYHIENEDNDDDGHPQQQHQDPLTESWINTAECVFLFHAISSLWTIMMDGFVDYAHDEYNCGDNDLDDDDYHCDDNDHEEDNPILERGRTDGGLRCLLKLIQITCGLFCF